MLHQFTWVDLFDGLEEALIRILRVVKPRAARAAEAANIETIAPSRAAPAANGGAFAAALDVQSPKDVAAIKERLYLLEKSSTLARNGVANLLAESNLPTATMLEFVHALRLSPPESNALREAISDVARRHTLKGPPAAMPPGTRLIRVVSFDAFADHLSASAFVPSGHAARALVRRLLQRKRPPKKWAAGITIGRFVIWAIMSIDKNATFMTSKTASEDVLNALGLPHHRAGEPLLAITYTLPTQITARVPTFCDAYAGSWPYLFRVAAPGAPYGLTVPRDETGRTAGLPEVVHAPITLDHAESIDVIA